MKKRILSLAIGLLSITALITSCKKHIDDVVSPATPTCNVTSVKNLETKDSTVQKFDSQNRLIKAIWYDKSGNLLNSYDAYTYDVNKLTYTFYSDATTIAQQTQYVLNPLTVFCGTQNTH